MLPTGEFPPDECVEIALWDRFSWGPEQTDNLTIAKLRIIFAVIEQQRVSRDRMENLGQPNQRRADALVKSEAEAKAMQPKPKMTIVNEDGLPIDGSRPKRTLTIVDENGNPVPGNKTP